MKAMILAAGRGERLRPLTDHTPKPLLKAGKYRLIEHLIFKLVAAGADEIIINYAHLGEQFPQTLGNGSLYGTKISYSPELKGGLETAGGIINALPLLGKEPFLIVNGDIWTDYQFEQLLSKTLSQDVLCHLVLVNNPEHNPDGDFTLTSDYLLLEGDIKHTYSGIGIYHPKMFKGFEPQKLALKPLLVEVMQKRQASGELFSGQWSDIGTAERLEQLNMQLG